MNMFPLRLALGCGLLTACTGTIGAVADAESPSGEPSMDTGGSSGSGSSNAAAGKSASTVSAGVCQSGPEKAPLRRLTRVEYTNTVRDLLGINSKLAKDFESDTAVAGFETNGIATLSASGTLDYAEAATTLADQIDVAKLTDCDPKTATDACARTFISNFGQRAFRRPLTPSEIDGILKIFSNKKVRSDFGSAARLVVETLLQAPSFLYRPDVAPADDSAASKLARSYEMASRLSYFLWGSMPDETLFAAAQSGAVLIKEKRVAEVRRMLADPRANASLRNFYDQWMDGNRLASATKDSKLFPQFNDDLKASMKEETGRFVEYISQSENGSLTALLTSPVGFVDANLAKLYGVTAPASGFTRTEMPAGQRSGLLTQAGFFAGHSFAGEPSPIHRGLFVRRKLLCQDLQLPKNVEVKAPAVDPAVSLRDRLDQHRKNPLCANCHQLMDPIGFGFGNYDAIGRWQTMEGKFKADSLGEISGTDEIDGTFDGAPELAKRLASSAIVQRCMTQQWFRFALGREETAAEECLMDQLAGQLRTKGLDLRELVVSIATSDAFATSHTQ
jgi:hypothetical protein